jgi:hypothetical protein
MTVSIFLSSEPERHGVKLTIHHTEGSLHISVGGEFRPEPASRTLSNVSAHSVLEGFG